MSSTRRKMKLNKIFYKFVIYLIKRVIDANFI